MYSSVSPLHSRVNRKHGRLATVDMHPRVPLAIALTLSACAPADLQQTASSTGITTVVVDATSEHEPTSTGGSTIAGVTSNVSAAGSSTSTTTGASSTSIDPFTTGEVPDFESTTDEPPAGCGGKIDFLFVIDRDSTMWDQLEPIQASLPGFVETMQGAFEHFDVHIMTVVAGGFFWGMHDCEQPCQEQDTCVPTGPADYPCYGHDEIDACDGTNGAGVTFPAAWGASNKRCQLAGGNRYIIDSEPDLLGAFECIATMGMMNTGYSMPAYSMQKALDDEILGPGGCNEGFLRKDALLVVTFLTDTMDNESPGTPEEWAYSLRKAKAFDDDAIVILGLIPDVHELNNVCPGPGGGDYYPPLNKLLTMFPHTVLGSICSDNYVPFFNEAADKVLEVCEQYIPQ